MATTSRGDMMGYRDTVSSSLPADTAERISDRGGDRDEKRREQALERLVDVVMDRSGYPKRGSNSICMDTILCETDASELSDAIRDCLFADGGSAAIGWCSLEKDIREIVTRYLTDSEWHDRMEQELIEEESDDKS